MERNDGPILVWGRGKRAGTRGSDAKPHSKCVDKDLPPSSFPRVPTLTPTRLRTEVGHRVCCQVHKSTSRRSLEKQWDEKVSVCWHQMTWTFTRRFCYFLPPHNTHFFSERFSGVGQWCDTHAERGLVLLISIKQMDKWRVNEVKPSRAAPDSPLQCAIHLFRCTSVPGGFLREVTTTQKPWSLCKASHPLPR